MVSDGFVFVNLWLKIRPVREGGEGPQRVTTLTSRCLSALKMTPCSERWVLSDGVRHLFPSPQGGFDVVRTLIQSPEKILVTPKIEGFLAGSGQVQVDDDVFEDFRVGTLVE